MPHRAIVRLLLAGSIAASAFAAAFPAAAQTLTLSSTGYFSATLSYANPGTTEHTLEWSSNNNFTTILGTMPILTVATRSNLPGGYYFFRVRGPNGLLSNMVQTLVAARQKPAATLTGTSVLGASITWTVPLPDAGVRYQAKLSTSPSFPSNATRSVDLTGHSAVLPLPLGVVVYIAVHEWAVAPISPYIGPMSNVLTASIPNAVTILSLDSPTYLAAASDPSGGAIRLTWSAVTGATFYRVSRIQSDPLAPSSFSILGQTNATGPSYITPTLGANVTASYRVQACSAAGCGLFSTPATAKTGSSSY